jgi:hypothetical protein
MHRGVVGPERGIVPRDREAVAEVSWNAPPKRVRVP